MILHQGKIQHISPDELKKGARIEKKKKALFVGQEQDVLWWKVEGKVHKSLKLKEGRVKKLRVIPLKLAAHTA